MQRSIASRWERVDTPGRGVDWWQPSDVRGMSTVRTEARPQQPIDIGRTALRVLVTGSKCGRNAIARHSSAPPTA